MKKSLNHPRKRRGPFMAATIRKQRPVPLFFLSVLFFLLLCPGLVFAWGVDKKDIQKIKTDLAVLYEKLAALEQKITEDNKLQLGNQAAANTDITVLRDDLQSALIKLDELTQFVGTQMEKESESINAIKEGFDIFSKQTLAMLNKISERSSLSLAELKESGNERRDAVDKKLDGLIDLLKTFLETEKADKEKLEADMEQSRQLVSEDLKRTVDQIAELVKINKGAVRQLSKKPGKEADKVKKELSIINKKILELVGILKSSMVGNSNSMKGYNKSVQKILKSIDERLRLLSGRKKKP